MTCSAGWSGSPLEGGRLRLGDLTAPPLVTSPRVLIQVGVDPPCGRWARAGDRAGPQVGVQVHSGPQPHLSGSQAQPLSCHGFHRVGLRPLGLRASLARGHGLLPTSSRQQCLAPFPPSVGHSDAESSLMPPSILLISGHTLIRHPLCPDACL